MATNTEMINKENIKRVLTLLGFVEDQNVYSKHFGQDDFYLKADFNKNELIYPENKGLKVNERQTCNFSSNENFVVFECVHRLLEKGYKPEHIELEPKWKLGHGASGGRADIFVRNQQGKPLLIIECKTAGKEFDKAWKDTQLDGGQLFSYIEQEKDIEFVCLYAAGFDEKTSRLSAEQRIVSHKDNEKILTDDPNLKAFKDAKNVKERFRVWKDTYQLEYTEKGIFEKNIQPYQIGKDKYTLDVDTKAIEAFDIKGKYHQFRTILRKYNVSRRENAFEVLVNLFLCKLVDENESPNDLKFYWKGIAYDNYYDLVDRLQELYKIGMERFLDQEITYVSNDEIEKAFWAIKQKRNATKQKIKELFKTLKFFNDNNFGFIGVKNKQGFEKNAKILLEIIRMWQGLRLKTKEQNQFLGDMFEFFLDNGIKQSEGQFFTPLPICKFIVMSLPLENQIQASNDPLKVIDYACGSGHFLTEYALQIKPLVTHYKQTAPNEYYKNIFGIEKEDRLAKVAKVSAFMYGRDEINILDADALASNNEIKDDKFDVLIANPPFAVEDFLLTLDETDREKYELLQTVSDLGNKNIQCFFLERAKQLLAANGTMGVIVPSSVLSNSDTMHIATREILLKYFDFVSIVELGSGTFGKTGTNTVVLFLRRKPQRPEPAEHFWNRTLDFFENWEDEAKTGGGAFMDAETVRRYCQHIDIALDDYETLLMGKPSADLLATEMFKDYKTDFDNTNDIKKLKEAKQFKAKTAAEQKTELEKRFLKYLQDIEQQKLYYFILANSNPQKVLIVKSPNDNKEQKQFLGYEWSGAKGSEGIKYNGGDTIHDIITPMFDPNNRQNDQKINYYIQQNFEGQPLDLPEHLQPFVTMARLEDLLDFSRRDFNKALSLSPKKNTGIETQWELVRLEDISKELFAGGDAPKTDFSKDKTDNYRIPIYANGIENNGLYGYTSKAVISEPCITISARGTLGYVEIRKEPFVPIVRLIVLVPNNRIDLYFLKMVLSEVNFNDTGSVIPQLTIPKVRSIKIPLPPLSVQQQIVAECEAIDQKVSEARAEIEKARGEIEERISKIYNHNHASIKIKDLCQININTFGPTSKQDDIFIYIDIDSVGKGNGIIDYSKNILGKNLPSRARRKASKGCSIISTVRPYLKGFAFLQSEPPENCVFSTGFAVLKPFDTLLHDKLLFLLFMYSKELMNQMESAMPKSSYPSINKEDIENFQIPVPPLSEQTALVAEIEKLEAKIAEGQSIIQSAAAAKQAVMKKYL